MRQGSSSCASDSVGAKRTSLSVPGSPLETRAADVSRNFISLEWNEMFVVAVVVAHKRRLVSPRVVMIQLERIISKEPQHADRQLLRSSRTHSYISLLGTSALTSVVDLIYL